MKTKVLFLVSTLERGGPTNIVYNIIKYLNRNLIEPVVITLSKEPDRSRKKDFEELDIEVTSFHKNRLYWLLSDLKELRLLVKKVNPKIIHSHSFRPDVSSANHFESYVRISTIHGDLHANYRNTYNRVIGNYLAAKQLNHINQLDVAVACSQSVFELYKDKIKSIQSINNGIDNEIFKPLLKEAVREKRRALNLPDDCRIWISAGSLSKRKDPHTVILGFLGSNSSKKSLLIILGSGELEQRLRILYASHHNVVFKGFIPNVADFISAADFFISASTSEGLPNTVMEALGCGLPVCISDIPSHVEILNFNSATGKTFPCGDIAGLSNAIDSLDAQDYTELRKAAASIVSQHLNAKLMSSNYQQLYLKHTENERQ